MASSRRPAASYWKGVPRQGWLYLSISHLSFYSFILGREVKVRLRWTDIVSIDKSNSLIFPDSIKISTRQKSVSSAARVPERGPQGGGACFPGLCAERRAGSQSQPGSL